MESLVKIIKSFKGKRVLITGHTGFKGSWLTLWLSELGARITGISLDPQNPSATYYAMNIKDICNDLRHDINDYTGLLSIINQTKPEIVFHLAAQPLVLDSYNDPLYTFNTNIIGTANVLEACRQTDSVKAVTIITSDKCYWNSDSGVAFVETDRLGGEDPYSSSKASAEIVAHAYHKSFYSAKGIGLATARAGNVIGGGDWSDNRIIPDCIRGLINGKPIEIRNPLSVRPWQHVLEPLVGYLLLTYKLFLNPEKYSGAWNFGPRFEGHRTVNEIVEELILNWGQGKYIINIGNEKFREAQFLNLNTNKARTILGWQPVLTFGTSVKLTSDWYNAQINFENMKEFSLLQIRFYESLMKNS